MDLFGVVCNNPILGEAGEGGPGFHAHERAGGAASGTKHLGILGMGQSCEHESSFVLVVCNSISCLCTQGLYPGKKGPYPEHPRTI